MFPALLSNQIQAMLPTMKNAIVLCGVITILFSFGFAVAQDEPREKVDIEALKQLAGRGNADAQFEMGIRYLGGEALPKDPKLAAEWLQKAADQQHLGAMNAMGTLSEEGVGVAKDEKKAIEWYQKAAKFGFPLAQVNLAQCYEKGTGVAKDEKEAVKWLSRAAHQDFPPAQAQYAWKLEHGQGIEKNTPEAAGWYLKAAQSGLVAAMTHLAYMYFTGQGVPLDYRRAEAWYRRAARSEDPWARNDLAWFLSVCPDENFHDGEAAVEFAKSAVEKMPEKKRYELVDTLAAALARAGKYGDAVQNQMKAIVGLAEDKEKELKPEEREKMERELSDRLGLYRKRQSYTEKDPAPEAGTKPLLEDRILQEEEKPRRNKKPAEKNNGGGVVIS
jgi:TPR repeat protein